MANPKKAAATPEGAEQETKQHYEEWRCEVKKVDGAMQVDKLKKLRDNVKITEEEVEILNAGARGGISSHAIMYFLPGEEA